MQICVDIDTIAIDRCVDNPLVDGFGWNRGNHKPPLESRAFI